MIKAKEAKKITKRSMQKLVADAYASIEEAAEMGHIKVTLYVSNYPEPAKEKIVKELAADGYKVDYERFSGLDIKHNINVSWE